MNFNYPKAVLLSATILMFHFQGFSNIDKAWNAFKNNRFEEAKSLFNAATGEDKADAKIGLALIYSMENKELESFGQFQEFTTIAKNPYPYAFGLWSTETVAKYNKIEKERVSFLESILKDPKADGTIKAMANETLAKHYLSANNKEKSLPYNEAMGVIKKWMILGEFENISASGFNKNFGALEHPEPSYVFKNKNNADVKWFPLINIRNDQWIDYEYLMDANNSIVYAQTFIESPVDQDVELRLGTSGSYKIWLNDNLVSEMEEERNNDLDTYNSRAKLKKGNNRILIQLGESLIGNLNFMLRITDKNGDPIKDLIASQEVKKYIKDLSTSPNEQVPIFAEKYFQDKIKANKNDLLSHLMLINAYLRNQKTFDARKVIKEVETSCPKSLYLLSLKNNAFNQDRNSSGSSSIIQSMKEIDSNSLYALQLLFSDEYEKENYDAAEALRQKLEDKYDGQNEDNFNRKINLALKKKENEKLEKLVMEAQKKFPDNFRFMTLKYEIEKELRKNKSAAMNTLKNYAKSNDNDDVTITMISMHLEDGNVDQATKLFKKLIEAKPYTIGYKSKLANLYTELKQYDQALTILDQCIEETPNLSGLYSMKANILKEKGDKKSALENYKKAITYYPLDYASREQINLLNNDKPIFDNFVAPKFDELAKIKLDPKDYPDDHSYVLTQNVQTVVYKGGIREEKHFVMIRAFNSTGVDYWKEYSIDVDGNEGHTLEEAYIIKKNGTRVDAESNDNLVVFKSLEPEDNICLIYKVFNYSTGKLADHFWDNMVFSKYLPSKSIKYSLMIDKNTKFNWKMMNSSIQPEIKEVGENKIYIWEKNEFKAIKDEALMPTTIDIGEVLHISTIPDWDFVSKWYSDLASTKTKPDYEVKEIVHELFDSKTLSPEQKVKEIYNYIVKNIRYSSISFRQSGLIPQRPADVLNTKIGDCKDVSSLFVAMCKEIGVEANLCLIATRNNGKDQMVFPSIDFNHCIANVTLNGKSTYLELTSDLYPYATFNKQLINATALDIKPTTSNVFFLNPTDRKKTVRVRNSTFTFNANNLMIERSNIKTGTDGASMREVYKDKGQDQQNKTLKESLSDEYPSVKLDKFIFQQGLDYNADTVKYIFSYSVPKASLFQEVAGMQIMKMAWSDEIESMGWLNEETRSYPIEFFNLFNADEVKETITFSLPEGKTLAQTPKDVVLKTEFADYSMTFVLKGKELIAIRSLTTKKDVVSADKFGEVKKFFEAVVKADNTQLAFK
jgi:tetratricopeptide (TPR) repeat protein